MKTGVYSERGVRVYSLTLGNTTAFSDSVDFSPFAAAALVVPAGATGSLEVQTEVNGSWYYVLRSTGTRLVVSLDSASGNCLPLPADIFPLQNIRLALTDGNGTSQPGAMSYTMHLIVKT